MTNVYNCSQVLRSPGYPGLIAEISCELGHTVLLTLAGLSPMFGGQRSIGWSRMALTGPLCAVIMQQSSPPGFMGGVRERHAVTLGTLSPHDNRWPRLKSREVDSMSFGGSGTVMAQRMWALGGLPLGTPAQLVPHSMWLR